MSLKISSFMLACLCAFTWVSPAFAGHEVKAENALKQYFNDVVVDVKQAESPAEKRVVLDRSFEKLISVLDRVSGMTEASDTDRTVLAKLKHNVQEKRDELHGQNGFEAVEDAQLNAFADYVLQDMEQADKVITISLTSLLLIIVIVLLIAR